MIRKLKTGSYRLYSRKVDPKTGRRRNLGTFRSRSAAESTSAPFSFSSLADLVRPLVGQTLRRD